MNPGAPAPADDAFDAVFAIRLPPRPYPGLRPFDMSGRSSSAASA